MNLSGKLGRLPAIFWVLGALFFLYLFTSRGGYDGYELENYLTAENIILNHSIAIAPGYSNLPGIHTSTDGSPVYIRHNLAQPLMETPLYALGYLSPIKLPQLKVDSSVSAIGSLSTTTLLSVSLFNILMTICTILILYLFSKRILKNEMQAVLMGIMYGLGTIAWPYSAIGLEPLMVFSLFAAYYFLFAFKEDHRSYQILGAAISIAILINSKLYAYVFVAPLVVYIISIVSRNTKLITTKNVIFSLIPTAIGLAIFISFNLFRFGNILGSFDTSIDYRYIFDNLLTYTISPGKGIIVYSPIIALAVFSFRDFYRMYKTELIIIALIALCLLVVILPSWFIRSDEMWGPRYANVLIPFLVLISSLVVVKLLKKIKGQIMLAALFIISVWIQLVGLSFYGNVLIDIAFRAGVKNIDEVLYIPRLSPIVIGSELYLKTTHKNLTGIVPEFSYTLIPGTSATVVSPMASTSVDLGKDAHFITLPFRALSSQLKGITALFNIVICVYVAATLLFLFKNKKLHGVERVGSLKR